MSSVALISRDGFAKSQDIVVFDEVKKLTMTIEVTKLQKKQNDVEGIPTEALKLDMRTWDREDDENGMDRS